MRLTIRPSDVRLERLAAPGSRHQLVPGARGRSSDSVAPAGLGYMATTAVRAAAQEERQPDRDPEARPQLVGQRESPAATARGCRRAELGVARAQRPARSRTRTRSALLELEQVAVVLGHVDVPHRSQRRPRAAGALRHLARPTAGAAAPPTCGLGRVAARHHRLLTPAGPPSRAGARSRSSGTGSSCRPLVVAATARRGAGRSAARRRGRPARPRLRIAVDSATPQAAQRVAVGQQRAVHVGHHHAAGPSTSIGLSDPRRRCPRPRRGRSSR